MTLKVRPMVAEDKPPVIHILRTTTEFKPIEVTVAEELIDAYLAEGKVSGYVLLVAEENGVTLGHICFGDTPLTEGTWDIFWIAVSKQQQGKGVGRALMSAAEEEIKTNRGRLILIETSSTIEYEKTRRFYHNIGYSVICRIPDFYTPGDDKIVLEKRFD
jgi:ribosomal protein S18 acetylase RimI-like enzyme